MPALPSHKPHPETLVANELVGNGMPHATAPEGGESEDEDFNKLMRQINAPTGEDDVSLDFLQRELHPGEKADDAVDYEDIDDDDLPEEEAGFAADSIAAAKGIEMGNDWDMMEGVACCCRRFDHEILHQ